MNACAERLYFTVLDESGRAFPAVEYWAGAMEQIGDDESVIGWRRFIRLIGSESMCEADAGVFRGMDTGITYTRLPTAS